MWKLGKGGGAGGRVHNIGAFLCPSLGQSLHSLPFGQQNRFMGLD